MAEITFDGLNENSLIMQWNTDNYGNPKSIHINNEIQQVSPTHNVIQLAQIPDEYYRVKFVAEGIDGWLLEVRNLRELEKINQFYVDYNHGIVYFHEEMAGRLVRADYYGRGVMFLSDARIFHKSGDSFATTLDEVLEKSKDAFKLLESTGGLNEAIELLDDKAEEGTIVANRLENFISETEFYGYTIVLSREAFVVKAKEDGNLHDGELEDLTVDVVVYKGAKSLVAPDLNVRIYSTTNCECEIDSQTVKITHIDVNAIKGQAIIEIDCGDGLIAYRTIEVTKVFDGVSQFNVEMTNSFYSFNATHSGKIEEEQSVTCEFNITKANEVYTGYVVGIQNMPTGMICNLTQPTENATSVTFTVPTGNALPDNGSISLVFQMNDNTVITKTFVFSKTKQGLSAKSLMLAGNQIIHYEDPSYSGTPTPLRTSIVAQVTDLSGTPVWSYLENEQWIVIDGQNGTSLNLYHNDRIWGDKRELTIKCELDGMSDEITLIKIANGATGLSSYSVILSNESTTLRVNTDGTIPTEELTSQYTRITAFKGSDPITPTSISVPTSELYEVEISGATINLVNVDTSTTTVNIPIEIILDGAVKIDKVWNISKTEPGENGAAGAVYSINVDGGTRAITYNQLNENPRPTFSGMFTATIYENGNDITSQVVSWYWVTEGHLTGTSIENSFIPEIKDTFDETILNNSVTVTAIYKHTPISYTVPIVVAKDVSGLDWVTDWDSTKVTIRDTEILTPKIFAGTYNSSTDSITGVAIGTDVLNDGQVQGITAWQDNEVSFLLGTDGSLLVGNPFDVDGSGLSYNDGRFILNVDDMSIAGVTVPTWDDMEEQLSSQGQAIIDAIQGNIDNMNNTLNDMTNYVDHILQDEVITELEKAQLDALFEVIQQEVIGVQAQYDSVISNPYLPNEEVINLEECYANYIDAYNNIVDVYNDVFGEGTVEEIQYTTPSEEYLETSDFSLERVDQVDANEVLDSEEQSETPVMLADVNEVSLDTLITKDGYVLVTLNGEVITMVTENTLLDFEDAVAVLRDYSSILQQAISEALLSISENRAAVLVEEAKEEVRAEIADVDTALSDLETTMNGSFKSGLIGEQSKAILNERLRQLDIEKKDVDGQYEVLSQNSALDSTSKEKLGLAKSDLDTAHDLLVAKINQVIVDNLMTDSELQAINNMISEYANELQNYSKVAQECNATIAVNTANLAVEAITDEDVFNKVTNYGVTQGLFIKDEKVYINSEYIYTRNFKAVTDDGTQTFLIDENGEVSITAKSLAITGSSNLATQDYVNTQIENVTNTNVTFTLSNEFQIIPTDESYYPLSEGTYSITVKGYLGSSEEITDFTIGTVSSDSGVIAVVSNIDKKIIFTVSPDTPLDGTNGYIDIPITYNNREYNKRWSWAVSKQGNQATYVTITGEQFFKYTNNYTGTPTPSSITLTANVFNSTETGKWQYYDESSTTWIDCGITVKTLTLSPTDYTLSSLKRVFVRYYVDSVFDTYSVNCISDGSNGTNGKGISTIENKYLATNLSSSVTTSTSGWTSVVQEISSSKKYLWNYEIITYTDNTTTETTPCIIGTYGEDGETGVGISNITEYYLISSSTDTSDVLSGDWSTSIQIPNKDAKYLWNYSEIVYTNGNKSAQSPRIIGNFAEDGASGSDAYTILLTNENHTFVANHLGATTEQIVYSDVIAYKGATPVTPTIGTLPTVTGLTLAKSGVRITIKSNTGTSLEDNGSFDIPITVDEQSFIKTFSWTKVKDGSDGASGESAKSVDLLASNMVFKSTDGGVVFTPDNITLTAQYQNLTHSKWQYSVDGGTTWINIYDGNNGGWQGGITGTSDSLTITIPKTCTFFTDTVTSVVFKTISTDESFYDVITITKLYDVADVDFEGIAEDIAQDKVDELDSRLNQQAVFDRLTNNGTSQGIYLEDGQLYINGEYIEANSIKVDQLEVGSITMFVEDKVQTGIEDIQIGGANLLLGTDKSKELVGTNTENQITDSYYFVERDKHFANLADETITVSFDYTVTQDATGIFRMQTNGIKQTSLGETSDLYVRLTDVIDVATNPTGRVVKTSVLTDKPTSGFNGVRFRADNLNGTLTISNVKIERGNMATDWSPSVKDTSNEIQDKVDNLNNSLNQNEIFSRLTNNGQSQGIFLENGELYVNGEFINSKNLSSVDNSGNQTFLIDENGNVHINANTFTLGGKGVTTTQDVLDLIDEYGQAENLLLVPNFNGGSLTGWSWSVSSYVFVDTTYKHDGNTACKLNYTGTSNAISLATTSMSIDKFESGKTYKVSMWIYVEDKSKLTNTMYLRVNGIPSGSSSSVVIAERTIKADNLVNNQWTQLSFEFTCLQDHTTPRLLVSVTGGISAWVTDFAIQIAGEGMSQEQIVNILNGAGQGLYIVDGQTLINAEYIKTGILAADLIKVRVDDTSNLLPFNYITMDNAINGEFYINEDSNGYPFAECDLPIYNGGGDNDTLCTPFGYSNINIEQGKSYWFSCEYYAQWNNDTKPDDGVGTSTIGGGNKTGIGTKTGNNLDLFLFNGTDTSKINYGRNLLDNTDGRSLPKIFSVDTPFVSGFSATASPESSYEYGHLMLTASGNQEVEHFYRFMLPIHTNLYELEQGCTYVLSGLICGTMSEIAIRHEYSSNGGTWIGDTQYNIPIASTDEWQSFTYTFTVPSDATGFYLSFQDYNRETGTICYLAHLKLEKSEVATPWCLSPYDSTGTNPSYVEQSNPVMILASVLDFNESINIVERENYEGVYQRGWTRLVGRIDAKFSYEGNLWINIDGSGFEVGDQGWFYLKNLQLMDASENDEAIELDYIQQLKEKRIELTDGSYYTNLVGVDGIKLTEGVISGKSNTSQREFELNYDGLEFKSTTGSENAFLGLGQAQYSYDGGSSGTIYGYDELYGVGTRYLIEDTGDYEGIFIGVHKGFQIPNSTAYGRPDIYVRNRYSDRNDSIDWTDWNLLGARIEPLGLVRRDEQCNITTNGLFISGSNKGDNNFNGGTNWHGSVIFSEPIYNTTGNGQIVNTNTSTQRIYFGNPDTHTYIESKSLPIISVGGSEKPIIVNGIQDGDIQTNIYTGNSIEIWADRDKSTTTERVWIGAGGNGLTITSSGTGQNIDGMKYNGNIVINTANLHDKIYIGAQDSTETGRDIKDWGVHSYNLYNKSLTNGDGTSSAYGGYWSVLTFGNGTSGSAQLAIDWTASGRGFYMRSLRDTGDNWWTWKRIGNSEWLLDSTSDERYKRAMSEVSTEDCYNMVKNIELHSYLLLTEEERYRVEHGELDVDELFLQTTTSEGIHHNLQMGVLAQDMLKYSFGSYVVNQEIMRDENGNVISDRYGIDAYNYASAILGGLQEEIKVRDEQYEELKKENEDLKARLEKLEKLILKGE